jgi:hypothetical protein
MNGGMKSRFDTNKTNKATKHTTSLPVGGEFMRICKLQENHEVFQ